MTLISTPSTCCSCYLRLAVLSLVVVLSLTLPVSDVTTMTPLADVNATVSSIVPNQTNVEARLIVTLSNLAGGVNRTTTKRPNTEDDGAIGYGGEYADEWPIYVAILGLTVFAYIAWVLVYCLCQRRSGTTTNYEASSTGSLELASQRSPNIGNVPTITAEPYYDPSTTSMAGSPGCSLEGASLHEMIPPKYHFTWNDTGRGNSGSFTTTEMGGNNTSLARCDWEEFSDDGEDTCILVPRLNGGRNYSSPPGYSDLTRISVVINGPPEEQSSETTLCGVEDNTGDTNPLVTAESNGSSTSAPASSHHPPSRHRLAKSVSNSGAPPSMAWARQHSSNYVSTSNLAP